MVSVLSVTLNIIAGDCPLWGSVGLETFYFEVMNPR